MEKKDAKTQPKGSSSAGETTEAGNVAEEALVGVSHGTALEAESLLVEAGLEGNGKTWTVLVGLLVRPYNYGIKSLVLASVA
jgi:hypothetical protein